MKKQILFLVLLVACLANAQDDEVKAKAKALEASTNLTWDANKALSESKFIDAEVDYRKAIAKSPPNMVGINKIIGTVSFL